MEVYSPSYLFNADGTDAVRPAITGVTPRVRLWSDVSRPDAGRGRYPIGRARSAGRADPRVRHGSAAVELSYHHRRERFARHGAPERQHRATRLLPAVHPEFRGRAVGRHLRKLSASIPNQAPTATITSPTADMKVDAGQSVFFSGDATDSDGTISAYSWTFPGGSPASASVANPGYVQYSTPGTFVASFKATDNGGLSSSTVSRTITVPDFSLTASPSSQTLSAGAGTLYTATSWLEPASRAWSRSTSAVCLQAQPLHLRRPSSPRPDPRPSASALQPRRRQAPIRWSSRERADSFLTPGPSP